MSTRIEIEIPDDLADSASSAGLLASEVLSEILRAELRRRSLRTLLAMAERVSARGENNLSDDDVDAEVQAERRGSTSR